MNQVPPLRRRKLAPRRDVGAYASLKKTGLRKKWRAEDVAQGVADPKNNKNHGIKEPKNLGSVCQFPVTAQKQRNHPIWSPCYIASTYIQPIHKCLHNF
jgi:hypothetical protein